MKLKPKAILFDMDGVLVDSFDSWLKALNFSLEKFKLDKVSREEFKKKYWGHDLRDTLKKMMVSSEIISFCNESYSKYVNMVKIYPDVLSTLKKLNNFKKGIITNTPRNCTLLILNKLKIINFFDVILTTDEVIMGKPNPEIIIKACDLLSVKPSDIIIVGDTKSDIIAGKTVGSTVIGLNIEADYVINNISELINIIEFD